MTTTTRLPIPLLTLVAAIATIFLTVAVCTTAAAFQGRDHLTPQEVDQVKDARALDKRIDVFIKAANRRMTVLNGGPDAAAAKQLKKDSEIWGELPAGSRAELIADIAGILDEAITNIDDVNARDDRNPLVAAATRKLGAAVSRIVEQLKPVEEQAKDEVELNNFAKLTENAESILEAAQKLPQPVPSEKKGKQKTEKQ